MKSGIVLSLLLIALLGACGESKTPKPKTDAATDTHPVKNVDALPAGTIREGAKTMNRAADMGGGLEQQKQDRDKEVESQSK